MAKSVGWSRKFDELSRRGPGIWPSLLFEGSVRKLPKFSTQGYINISGAVDCAFNYCPYKEVLKLMFGDKNIFSIRASIVRAGITPRVTKEESKAVRKVVRKVRDLGTTGHKILNDREGIIESSTLRPEYDREGLGKCAETTIRYFHKDLGFTGRADRACIYLEGPPETKKVSKIDITERKFTKTGETFSEHLIQTKVYSFIWGWTFECPVSYRLEGYKKSDVPGFDRYEKSSYIDTYGSGLLLRSHKEGLLDSRCLEEVSSYFDRFYSIFTGQVGLEGNVSGGCRYCEYKGACKYYENRWDVTSKFSIEE
jgi:hypothetical protein